MVETGTNFIDIIAETFQLRASDMNIDLACTSAHALIGSVTGDKIFVQTYKGLLSADIMCMVVAHSGTDKTIVHFPVEEITRNLRLDIPAVFTTESLPFYFDKKKYKEVEVKDKDGNTIKDGNGNPKTKRVEDGYKYKNYGLILWDEASGIFDETKNKKHRSGTIELLSSVYNHRLKKTFLKNDSQNVKSPQDPYISLLGNMIPGYFPKIDNLFFSQGTAGRIHWCYPPTAKPKKIEEQPDWNDLRNYNKSENRFSDIIIKLSKLDEILHDESFEPKKILLDDDANQLIKKFKYQTEEVWFTSLNDNPFGWDYQYYKRLPEMACKSALRYAIGDYIDDISRLKHITKQYMHRGIQFSIQSSKALQSLFTLKIGSMSNKTSEARAMNALMCAKNKMLNNQQWQKASGIPNPNHFQEIKENLISRKLVVLVDKATIKDEHEQMRLRVDTPAKIFQWAGGVV